MTARVVGALITQASVEDAGEFVGRCGDRGSATESRAHAPVEVPDFVVRIACSLRGHA
tara:strand:- start:712 stop:885 length:174 start_codon:yes stop_codon:yes gene_type:complete